MADKATRSAEELAQAYNKAIASGFAVADAGIAQTTAAVKMFADTVQTERDEYGKAIEQAVTHARARGENLAGMMQSMTAIPKSGVFAFTSEAKESVNKLVESEMAFYHAWTKGWMDYLSGVEARRSAAVQAMLESNAKLAESGQEAMKSAAKYGEALMDWSMESAKGMKS